MITTLRQSSPSKELFTGGRLRAQQSNNIAPLAAFSLSVPQGRALSICTLVLYFIVLNLSCVFYQLRGAAPEHYIFSAVSFYGGVLGGGLLMDAVERRCSGPHGKAWRFGFLAVLLLPGVFCLLSFSVADYSGNLFLNSLQPGLWCLPLAPSLRLFFRHESSLPGRAIWLGVASGAGHLCWALVLPLTRFLMVPGAAENSILLFIHITRCLLAFVVGYLAWKALDFLTAREPKTRPEPPAVSDPLCLRKAMLLLLAFLPCVLLNGTLAFILFARSMTKGAFPEFTQIIMALLFPLAGLWLAGKAGRLRPLLSAFILCFAFAPILLPEAAPLPSWLRQTALFLCIASLQGLYFCGTLCMAAIGPRLSRPSLALISVWAIPVTALAVPGLRALLKDFPSFNQWFCLVLTLACVGSVFLLRRVFPLPQFRAEPGWPEDNAPGHGSAEAIRLVEEAKQRAFAAAFDLTEREEEILKDILRGLANEAMATSLDISERTVRHHIGNLLKKTGASNRKRLQHYYTFWQV